MSRRTEARVRVYRVDLRAGDILPAAIGELTPAQFGLEYMISLLQLNSGAPIPDDIDWLRRKFKGTGGLRTLSQDLERLVELSRVCRANGELSVSWCRAEVERALSRISASAEHGARGGRPSNKIKQIRKGSGFQDESLLTPSPTVTPSPTNNGVIADAHASAPHASNEDFERFWSTWPSRRPHPDPKKPARQEFERVIRKGVVTVATLVQAARAYAGLQIEPQYRCQAVTFLRQQRFADQDGGPPRGSENNIARPGNVDWIKRRAEFLDTRVWPSDWGPTPQQPGCLMPVHLQRGRAWVNAVDVLASREAAA